MDTTFIRQLIRLVEESEIDELEISRWGKKVRIVKRRELANGAGPVPFSLPEPVGSPEALPASVPAPSREVQVAVKAPMVGTFYRAPAPEAPPFVEVGDRVRIGQTLCIIEAMKLMNELECEVNGIVRTILAENGEPVEYGQPLFEIEPTR